MSTTLGAYPSLTIGPLLDSHKHDIGAILRMIQAEELHAADVDKMLRKPGELAPYQAQ